MINTRQSAMAAFLTFLTTATIQPAAHAGLGQSSQGLWGEIGGGLSAGQLPFLPGVNAQLAFGAFVGRYDDAFSIGRRWQFGLRADHAILFASPRIKGQYSAVMVDVERGIDLLMLGLRGGLQGGLLIATPHTANRIGGTLRATGAVLWRFAPHVSLAARAHLGVDVMNLQPTPAFGLMIGFEVAGPVR